MVENNKVEEIQINQEFFIPNVKEDEITLSNLFDNSPPKMIKKNLDLKPVVGLTDYNDKEYIRVRVFWDKRWDNFNWSTGELYDVNEDPIIVDAVILHFHGGGFIMGSSGESQPGWIRYAKETGYPVFSVDYRLAPNYKFPTAISDGWIAYLWMRKYWETYMGISFKNLLLAGDSAGSNVSIGRIVIIL